jgi:hypothetical protein
MLKSVKFDSREVPVQELETNPQKVPYAIVDPAGDTLAGGQAGSLFGEINARNTRHSFHDVSVDR